MKLLVAGGGTGGHVFTGLAVVEELLSRDKTHQVSFVGAPQGMECRLVPEAGYPLRMINISGLKRVGIKNKIFSLLQLPKSFWESVKILFQEKPDVVLGVGGYSSGPIILIASLFRIPTAIIEQNSIPGLTNRLLGNWVKKVFLAFESTQKFFAKDKCIVTGNPIRKSLFANSEGRSVEDRKFNILVFGGSQGAKRIDRAMLDAIGHLKDVVADISILHQSRGEDLGTLSKAYENHGFDAEIVKFIDDMRGAYAKADLVLCRAGAISISEIASLGKPAILVPFPYAADNHQEFNARALADHGAALLIHDKDLTGKKLSEILHDFMDHPEKLKELGHNALKFSSFRAAQGIVDSCLLMARNNF